MIKEFIGKSYETEQDKKNILKNYDDYEKRKLIYLNEMYKENSLNTLINSWSKYEKHIHKFEELFNKDLMEFNSNEIKGVITNLVSYGTDVKSGVYNFINNYFKWCELRGEVITNPCNVIDRKKIISDNEQVLKKKIQSIDYIEDLLELSDDLNCLYLAFPLLLARYGIVGNKLSYMRKLKWEDIDYENKKVRICDEVNGTFYIPVDDIFLKWIKTMKETTTYDSVRKGDNIVTKDLYDNGYVLKKTTDEGGYIKNDSSVNSRNARFTKLMKEFDKSFKRISYEGLYKARILDFLVKARESGALTTDKMYKIDRIFMPKATKEQLFEKNTRLKRLWSTVGGDKIYTQRESENIPLVDNSIAKELANEYKIDLSTLPEIR